MGHACSVIAIEETESPLRFKSCAQSATALQSRDVFRGAPPLGLSRTLRDSCGRAGDAGKRCCQERLDGDLFARKLVVEDFYLRNDPVEEGKECPTEDADARTYNADAGYSSSGPDADEIRCLPSAPFLLRINAITIAESSRFYIARSTVV